MMAITPENLLTKLMRVQPNHFVMIWKGSKVPWGAAIGGIPIAWTQHGIVTGENGEGLGWYERVREWAGSDGDEHELVIATKHDSATNPTGNACVRYGPSGERV